MGRDTPTYDAAVQSTYDDAPYHGTTHDNHPNYPRGKHAYGSPFDWITDTTYYDRVGTGRTTDPSLNYGYTFHGVSRRSYTKHGATSSDRF
jgi:hypothetical protein